MSLEPLLSLPPHRRARLLGALRTGALAPPYGVLSLRPAIGSEDAEAVSAALHDLQQQGLAPGAVVLAVQAAERALTAVDRPELVWSGPEVAGVHARDTRPVFEELVDSAERSIWISTYTFFDGKQAFKRLAQRLDTAPGLQVTLLLNIQRKKGDTSAPAEVVTRFADRLWKHDWPGERRPAVFYDPRSLALTGGEGVLHAKALVVDDAAAFITSANLTEAAFDKNLELGVLSRDRTLASGLARHFRALIDQKHLEPLPAG